MRVPSSSAILVHLILLHGPAAGETIRVPTDFPTIHEALDQATSGDSVLVAAGTYTEAVYREHPWSVTAGGFLPVGVTLLSEGGPGLTTIEITGGLHVHCLVMAEATSPGLNVISGFTFRRNGTGGAAILVRNMPDDWSLVVDNCVFVNLRGGYQNAGGLLSWMVGNIRVRVANCEFSDVDSEADLGAIGMVLPISYTEQPTLTVEDCSFDSCDGRAIRYLGGPLTVSRCTFTNCTTFDWEGGSAIYSKSDMTTVEDSEFLGGSGTPVALRGGYYTLASVMRCRFENTSSGAGLGGAGAIWCASRPSFIEECWFENCYGQIAGAISLESSESYVRSNVFWGVYISQSGSGALRWSAAYGEIAGNTFAGCVRRAVWIDTHSQPTAMRNNVFEGTTLPAVTLYGGDGHLFSPFCNAYWNNAGHTENFEMGPGSFVADPLFCDPDNGDFTLSAQSPCLPGNHPDGADCGLIGALGQGCGPVRVEPETWAGIKARFRR